MMFEQLYGTTTTILKMSTPELSFPRKRLIV